MIPKINQRVRGKGTARTGVVVDVSNASDYVTVRWDGDNFNCHPAPHVLEWIDWGAPLELDDGTPVEFMQHNGLYHARVRLPRPHRCQPSHSSTIDVNAFDGLVVSNHKYRVRNRAMPETIDIARPMEVVTQHGVATSVDYVTTNLIGDIVVMPSDPKTLNFRWAAFNKSGSFLNTSDGSSRALTLRNRAKVETTEVDVLLPSGTAKIRVTTTDGTPTKVELV